MSNALEIQVATVGESYVVRLVGKATLAQSAFFQELMLKTLGNSGQSAIIDLSHCQHLDSTFLGCLIDLHRRFASLGEPRFALASPSETSRECLRACRLDRFFTIRDARFEDSAFQPLPPAPVDPRRMGRHVVACHRMLAEMGGPQAAAFSAVADQLEKELSTLENKDVASPS